MVFKMNIISDIAGRYSELIKLIEKMPEDEEGYLFLGDMLDRGNQSPQVIEFARTTPNVKTIRGNHEDMFLDYFDGDYFMKDYDEELWIFHNGGKATLDSYGKIYGYDSSIGKPKIPKEHLHFIRSLPLYIETDKFLITHAPLYSQFSLERACSVPSFETSILWNRGKPIKRDKFQIFGHCGELKKYSDYAICIDDSWKDKLTGLNTKTMEIFQQPYL